MKKRNLIITGTIIVSIGFIISIMLICGTRIGNIIVPFVLSCISILIYSILLLAFYIKNKNTKK